jgi:hypothetical protein
MVFAAEASLSLSRVSNRSSVFVVRDAVFHCLNVCLSVCLDVCMKRLHLA